VERFVRILSKIAFWTTVFILATALSVYVLGGWLAWPANLSSLLAVVVGFLVPITALLLIWNALLRNSLDGKALLYLALPFLVIVFASIYVIAYPRIGQHLRPPILIEFAIRFGVLATLSNNLFLAPYNGPPIP